jgi:hypothetical protein
MTFNSTDDAQIRILGMAKQSLLLLSKIKGYYLHNTFEKSDNKHKLSKQINKFCLFNNYLMFSS